jgi:hypothetical protein
VTEATPAPGDADLQPITAAAAVLDGIDELPLAEAARRFESLHAELQGALAALDES